MAGEGFLQRFYDASVFVRGDDEDFCAWRSYEVVEKTVAKLVEWLYQSSTRLYPEGAQPTRSHRQGLHLQRPPTSAGPKGCRCSAAGADENSHPRDNERITLQPWDPKCPAVQLIFWLGEEELVSVDLVPAVQDKMVLSEDWQTNDLARLSDWWDKELGNSQERFHQKGEEVGRVGADIVARDGFWSNFVLSVQTVLLWARDIHPETEKWETLESSLKTLLTLLRHCVNGGTLPHYFLRDFNLFNKRYGEGNGFYERLALQVLNKEEELLEVDPELFISLRLSKEVSECPGAFSRIEASLWEFKVSHWKALKELEEEELYKREEEHLGDRSIQAPRGGMVRAAQQFATVDVTSEDYPEFKNGMSEALHLVLILSLAQREKSVGWH
ncbi:unnamed protein product [Caretta caretta]